MSRQGSSLPYRNSKQKERTMLATKTNDMKLTKRPDTIIPNIDIFWTEEMLVCLKYNHYS